MSPSPWRKERCTIECCKDCKPPKRYPGCGDHCKEYKEEKAEIKRQMEEYKAKQQPAITQYDFDRVGSGASRRRR